MKINNTFEYLKFVTPKPIEKIIEITPYQINLYAMKSPAATKEMYLMRLGRFLNFLNLLGGTLEDKARAFADREEMIMHGRSIASSKLYNYSNNVLTVKK